MSKYIHWLSARRRVGLSVALACALGLPIFADATESVRPSHGSDTALAMAGAPPILRTRSGSSMSSGRSSSALPHSVTSCDDDANTPGTLRYEVVHAASGDTIDLSQLACSTITLGSEIVVVQDSLSLTGPGAGNLTIDGNSHSRIFNHTGSGILAAFDLSIANGYQYSGYEARGGCVNSNGTVALIRSVVSHCVVSGTGQSAVVGGGICADALLLDTSEISHSKAYSPTGRSIGGAAYIVRDVQAKYSTISYNAADASPPGSGQAGGIFAAGGGNVEVRYSTMSGNRSSQFAALYLGSSSTYAASIIDSTISSNIADTEVGGIFTKMSLGLWNTTIVLNTARASSAGAGLRSRAYIQVSNSIVAGNGGPDGPGDIGDDGVIVSGVGGGNSIVVASTITLPADTIRVCPKIGPLADNGGNTRTHALMHDSPGIDAGNDFTNLVVDQRLAPRSAGAHVDIGAVERQPLEMDDRVFVGGFDGLCDQ